MNEPLPTGASWHGEAFPLPVPARRRLLRPAPGSAPRFGVEPVLLAHPGMPTSWLQEHQWHRVIRGQLSGGRGLDKDTEAVYRLEAGRVSVLAFEGGPLIEAEVTPDLAKAIARNKRLLVIVAERPTLEDLRQMPKRPDLFVHSFTEHLVGEGDSVYTISGRAGARSAR